MRALYATLRLVWRPLTLLHLAFVWVVVSFLLQAVPDVSEVMPVLRALWHGRATPAMVTALWLVVAVAPAGIGLVVAMNRFDLQHTTLSWHLPDVRRRLLTGTTMAAFVPALALAALMSRNASPAATVAAFGLAFYSFLVPGFCFDAAGSRAGRVLMAVPFVAVVARPGSTGQLAHDHPLLFTTLALVLAGLLLPAITSAGRARVRPFRWPAIRQSSARALYWGGRKRQRAEWRQSLENGRLVTWLRATIYESAARYPIAHLSAAALAVLMARLIDIPQVIPIFAGSFLMTTGLQLRMRVAYPLSRVRRAQLAYTGTLVDAATYFSCLGALLYVTSLVPLPRLPTVDWESPRSMLWVLMWGCSLALVPIAQWRRIRWPDEDASRLSGTRIIAYLTRLVVYFFIVMLTAGTLNTSAGLAGEREASSIAMAILALMVQAAHAGLVYAHYTRGDLVRTRMA